MSPEVIRQDDSLDGRVDTMLRYVGYFMLTGRLPYDEPAVMETVMVI